MDSVAQRIPFRSGASPEAVDVALRRALAAHARAEHDVVLWFAEIHRRRLFQPLGYGTMYLYATQGLGFSESRTCQLLRIADALKRHAPLRRALASGRLAWTKAREIVDVMTDETIGHWIDRACTLSRRELVAAVARARTTARQERRTDPAQVALPADAPVTEPKQMTGKAPNQKPAVAAPAHAELAPELTPARAPEQMSEMVPALGASAPPAGDPPPTPSAPRGGGDPARVAPPGGAHGATPAPRLPRSVSLRMDPNQHATFEALVAELWTAGARGSRETLIIEGLEAALGVRLATTGRRRRNAAERDRSAGTPPAAARSATPFVAMRSPYQIYVRVCPSCRDAAITTSRGETRVGYDELVAMLEDADVVDPEHRRRATIPPRVRRAIYARDGFACRAPGCGRCQSLSVHHADPVSAGGTNSVENGVTMCWPCHRALHARTQRGRELRRWRADLAERSHYPPAPGTPGRGTANGNGVVREGVVHTGVVHPGVVHTGGTHEVAVIRVASFLPYPGAVAARCGNGCDARDVILRAGTARTIRADSGRRSRGRRRSTV